MKLSEYKKSNIFCYDDVEEILKAELSRLHSRIVEEGKRKKKPTDAENANSYTIADCNTEYNSALDSYEEIVNQAFKDL